VTFIDLCDRFGFERVIAATILLSAAISISVAYLLAP
jgi:hypothetical protein